VSFWKKHLKFLRKESCIIFGMGFATNANNIPCLIDNKSLILSDELNHTSIVLGTRLSEGHIIIFKHDNLEDLENKLINGIKTRKYNKILIIVEGIYSMEGSIVNLPEIIKLKKKYKAYLYIDEAHSIGAIGKTGRGVVEYYNCNPDDVDIMMGTFTKSFAATGGYIAASKKIINYIKINSHAWCYASSMSTPICLQIKYAFQNMNKKRLNNLKSNTNYFRKKLKAIGIEPCGDHDSPVVPVMLYIPNTIVKFNRMMLSKNIAVVTVGFPATELYGGRVRFCISSSHTKKMLDYIIKSVEECDYYCNISNKKNFFLSLFYF
jgi:serine palmitoyltransferase